MNVESRLPQFETGSTGDKLLNSLSMVWRRLALILIASALPSAYAVAQEQSPNTMMRAELYTVNRPGSSSQLYLQIMFSHALAESHLVVNAPAGSLRNLTLTALPNNDSVSSNAISKAELHCLDDVCGNFDAQLFFAHQDKPTLLTGRAETRYVEVHTSTNPDKTWYHTATVTVLSVEHQFSNFRLKDLDANGRARVDIQGSLDVTEGICKFAVQFAPWRGRSQTCVMGRSDDGGFLLRVRPVVTIVGSDSIFDVDLNELNTAFTSAHDVAIWLKVMPSTFKLPSPTAPNPGTTPISYPDLEKLPPAVTNSVVGRQMINEIENAARFPAVHDRIVELWEQKWRVRLSRFLSIVQPPSTNVSPRAQDARAMMGLIRHNNFPEVTSVVTLIESDFQSVLPNEKHAAGYWQFIPETGREYGLTVDPDADQRMEIGPSTVAALHLIRDLMLHYKGPNQYKLALASYNSGKQAVDRQRAALKLKSNEATKANAADTAKANDPAVGSNANEDQPLDIDATLSETKDFWDLYTYHLLYQETRNYVVDIMAASFLALHPELAHLPGDQALDRKLPTPPEIHPAKKPSQPAAPITRRPTKKVTGKKV